jgi:HEAT repeat protein
VAARRGGAEERLHAVVELSKRSAPPLGHELRPFLRDKVGIVAAAAAKLAGENDIREVEKDLEEAFARFLLNPVKSDPGCRAKLAIAEALRKMEVRGPDVYLRGIAHRQFEPSFGPPLDTAAPLRVCCAAALLETRHPLALLEVAPLLADPEPNARAGVASVLGGVGGEACEALLRLKVRSGDREPEVMGACLQGLLAASFERSLSFVVGAMKEAGDDDVVRLTLLALGESRDERALPLLREYAETSVDDDVRTAALLAMSVSRLPSATAFLVGLVEDAGERRAIEALSALESQRFDSALVGRLRAIAEDRGGTVREAFRKAWS